ncbi:GlsB/YeaQ/YmgE family stress response membrane protein [Leptospira interrogans]
MDFGPYTPYIVLAIVGLVAGWLCGLLLGGGGLIRNLIVGVIGAFVGGYLFYNILNIRIDLGNPWVDQIAIATIGAVVVTLLARAIAR